MPDNFKRYADQRPDWNLELEDENTSKNMDKEVIDPDRRGMFRLGVSLAISAIGAVIARNRKDKI